MDHELPPAGAAAGDLVARDLEMRRRRRARALGFLAGTRFSLRFLGSGEQRRRDGWDRLLRDVRGDEDGRE